MNDTEFFKEEAERFLSHACVTANPVLQETLLSFSSGFANYAAELETKRYVENVFADQDVTTAKADAGLEAFPVPNDHSKEPDALVLEACSALIAAARVDGDEIPMAPSFKDEVTDQEWLPDDHVEAEFSHGARIKCLFFAAILAPSAGLLFWTVANSGR